MPAYAGRGGGGGGGGFHGGGGGGFHGGGFHGGGKGFGHGHGHGHGRFDHNRFKRFNRFNRFAGFGGFGGFYGGDFGYDDDYYPDYYPYGMTRRCKPQCVPRATPVYKGYSTYYSADGYYNYPRATYPQYTWSPQTVAYCPPAKQRPARRSAKKVCEPSGIARSLVSGVQKALTEKGFCAGAADGIMGSKTRESIRGFQKKNGMEATGKIDAPLMKALGI